MYAAVNAWTFPHLTTVEDKLRAAAAVGFRGFELTLDADGPLTTTTPAAEFARLADCADGLGLQITSVASGQFWQQHYASLSGTDRQRASELTLRLLDAAAAARAEAILVVPAVVGQSGEPKGQVRYADAFHRAVDALLHLRTAAEERGVVIGVENVWNRFLLSPLEAADFIDRINSPYVGFYFDTGNVLAFGYPEDWIEVLGGRIIRVHAKDYHVGRPGFAGFCPLGEGHVDWPAVIGALGAAGYDGPLTYEGADDPPEMARRLARIVAGQRPLETEVPT
ncbi:MAG: sugar phosphate isomerase/epimerase [Phycisphaerales bacterium]|nr:sugar phosphate isomerase/epimerase [Phycisphaerales bacterium]